MENPWIEKLQNGYVFLIDKPLDWTSFDVVKKLKWNIKRQLGIKKIKIGHAGTLDPRATGLLIVCAGKATKTISEIQNQSKVYTATLKLGAQTPSYDTETEEENIQSLNELKNESIHNILEKFKGEIWQKPPIFSAIKKEGKRAYEAARKGEVIELDARKITIYELELQKVDLPFVRLKVTCSKGTYIRSLAHDIGNELGVGAYLYALRRDAIGAYQLEDADNDVLFDKNYFNYEA